MIHCAIVTKFANLCLHTQQKYHKKLEKYCLSHFKNRKKGTQDQFWDTKRNQYLKCHFFTVFWQGKNLQKNHCAPPVSYGLTSHFRWKNHVCTHPDLMVPKYGRFYIGFRLFIPWKLNLQQKIRFISNKLIKPDKNCISLSQCK